MIRLIRQTKQLLEEGITLSQRYAQAETVFLRYLSKRLKQQVYRVGGGEFVMDYRQGTDFGTGIRYVFMRPLMTSFRINWTSKKKVVQPTSIDVFLKNQRKPVYRLNITGIGLGAIAPILADVLLSREQLKSDIPVLIESSEFTIEDHPSVAPLTAEAKKIILDNAKKPDTIASQMLALGYSPVEVSNYAKMPLALVENSLRYHAEEFGTKSNPLKRTVKFIEVASGRPDKQEYPQGKLNEKMVSDWMHGNAKMTMLSLSPAFEAVKELVRSRDFALVVTGIEENGLEAPFINEVSKYLKTKVIDCSEMNPMDVISTLFEHKSESGGTLVLMGVERLVEDPVSRPVLEAVFVNRNSRHVALKTKQSIEKFGAGFEFKSNVVLVSDTKPSFVGNSITNPLVEIVLPDDTVFSVIEACAPRMSIGNATPELKAEVLAYLKERGKTQNGFTVTMFETAVVCRLTDQTLFDKLFMAHASGQTGGVAEF